MIVAFTPYADRLCKQLETIIRMRPHAWTEGRQRRLDEEQETVLKSLREINATVPPQWRIA